MIDKALNPARLEPNSQEDLDVTREQIASLYVIADQAAVLNFLAEHRALLPLVLEAPKQIAPYFPGSLLELSVVPDPEATDESEFFVYIHTSLSASEAVEQLDHLDEAWFLDADRRSGHIFNLNLRFE